MVPILASGLTEGSRVEKGRSKDGKAQGRNCGRTWPSAEAAGIEVSILRARGLHDQPMKPNLHFLPSLWVALGNRLLLLSRWAYLPTGCV